MTLFRNFLNCFRTSPASNRSTFGRSVRLEVECLDQRIVLSASSFNLHAVSDIHGNATAFFRSPTTDSLQQLSNGKLTAIASPHAVSDFSAGLDANGLADVFAHLNNRIQEFDNGAWSDLGQPMGMQSFAAVDGGRAYFVSSDHSLWEYSPVVRTPIYWVYNGQVHSGGVMVTGGWQELWGSNAVWSLDAVTERPNGVNSGRDVVFATGGDHRLEAYTQGGWFGVNFRQWVQITGGTSDGSPVVNSYSAGLDIQGNAEVYYIFTFGVLDRFDAGNQPSGIGGIFLVKDNVDPFATIRATSGGSFFMTDPQQGFVEWEYRAAINNYVEFGGIQWADTASDFAAGDTNNFFYISGHHIEEMSNGNFSTFQI